MANYPKALCPQRTWRLIRCQLPVSWHMLLLTIDFVCAILVPTRNTLIFSRQSFSTASRQRRVALAEWTARSSDAENSNEGLGAPAPKLKITTGYFQSRELLSPTTGIRHGSEPLQNTGFPGYTAATEDCRLPLRFKPITQVAGHWDSSYRVPHLTGESAGPHSLAVGESAFLFEIHC